MSRKSFNCSVHPTILQIVLLKEHKVDAQIFLLLSIDRIEYIAGKSLF